MSQPTVKPSETTHTDFVEERILSEEEDDIFFETEEPEIPGEEVVVSLSTAELKDKPSQSARTQVHTNLFHFSVHSCHCDQQLAVEKNLVLE